MAKFLCRCGEELSDSRDPEIKLLVYSNKEWDKKILSQDKWKSLAIPFPETDVWRCPVCERLYFFEENVLVKVYALESDLSIAESQ